MPLYGWFSNALFGFFKHVGYLSYEQELVFDILNSLSDDLHNYSFKNYLGIKHKHFILQNMKEVVGWYWIGNTH